MNTIFVILLLISLTFFIWYTYNICVFCKAKLTYNDRLLGGRIRHRAKGTQFPVCKCCAKCRPGDVD